MSYLMCEEHMALLEIFSVNLSLWQKIGHEALCYQFQRDVMVLSLRKLPIWNYRGYYNENSFVAMVMTVRDVNKFDVIFFNFLIEYAILWIRQSQWASVKLVFKAEEFFVDKE